MAKMPPAADTARSIRVKGGQIRTSASGGSAFNATASDRMSPSRGVSPCIFQFPAISGRIRTAALSLNRRCRKISSRDLDLNSTSASRFSGDAVADGLSTLDDKAGRYACSQARSVRWGTLRGPA
jgi:hypothetical protein